MASLNISLPAQLREWVTEKVNDGSYSSASDYLRDLIRADKKAQDEGWLWLSEHLENRLEISEDRYSQSSAADVKARARVKYGIDE